MTSRDKTRVWAYTGLPWKIDFNLSTRVSRINSLTIFRVQTLVVPPYIHGFLCIMDQNVSNFLLYTHILISQKINFVTEVRFSQKRSHIINGDRMAHAWQVVVIMWHVILTLQLLVNAGTSAGMLELDTLLVLYCYDSRVDTDQWWHWNHWQLNK